tara:strand:- start:1416 stop:1592 length:177 start_codon:yes stop_codon:yes gene_type:complete
MVKKIRVLEEVDTSTVLTDDDMKRQGFEMMKSMDWKLWEILQTMQRMEKRISASNNDT